MLKKDFLYAAIIGFITAIFATPIFIYSETPLAYGSFGLPLWSLFVILPVGEYIAYTIASGLFSHITALRQLGRFGIVGGMNFSVDTGIVYTLQRYTGIATIDPKIIYLFIFASVIAIINSYFWQRTWTFAEKAPPSPKEFMGFVTITVLGIAINTTVAFMVANVLTNLHIVAATRILAASKIAAITVSLFWNFLGYKFFVFRA